MNKTSGIDINSSCEKSTSFPDVLSAVLREIGELLLAKNKAYGNSALEPVRIFSQADPAEQIKVRIDDKLSRLIRGSNYGAEDTIGDLLGYLILLKVAERISKNDRG